MEKSSGRRWHRVHRQKDREGELGSGPPDLRPDEAGYGLRRRQDPDDPVVQSAGSARRRGLGGRPLEPRRRREAGGRGRIGHVRISAVPAAQASGCYQRSRKHQGNIKRFLPSEFYIDPARMEHALAPGRNTFDEKMEIRRAIEEANIPHTYVSANCFAAYSVPNLCQLGTLLPPKEKVQVYGDGNVKVVFMDEDDIGTYAIKTVDDPRALNKTIYLRPPENILTQNELIDTWEKLSGKVLEKTHVPNDELLASMEGAEFLHRVAVCHFHHILYEGCSTNFDIGDGCEEASLLYPEVQYTRMDEYMKRYL